jgi:hypothetical protein
VRRLAALAMAVLLIACGDGGDSGAPEDDPVLRPGDNVEVSKACEDQFTASHNMERSGTPTATAFLPSIQACSSLAEWSAAARFGGTRLNGQEARFVYGVCNAADAATQATPICTEARAQMERVR